MKTTLVVVCVGNPEKLAMTLPHNEKQVDEIIVVTSESNVPVIDTAVDHSDLLIASSAYKKNDVSFNLGAMKNVGLAAVKDPEWIITCDSDVFLHPRTSEVFKETLERLPKDELIYAPRVDATEQYVKLMLANGDLGLTGKRIRQPNGHFQMFHWSYFEKLGWPNVQSESFCSAGGCDTYFARWWPTDKHHCLDHLAVAHIDHESDWHDRTERPCWKLLGAIWPGGLGQVAKIEKWPIKVHCVDTFWGERSPDFLLQEDCLFPRNVVFRDECGDNHYMGKKNNCHIQVAYWSEG